jgi:hypothetical protein
MCWQVKRFIGRHNRTQADRCRGVETKFYGGRITLYLENLESTMIKFNKKMLNGIQAQV